MLRVNQLLIAGLALILAPGLQAACIAPNEVVIPDGANSTYEEMSDSQIFVREYMAEMETYLQCLEQEKSDLIVELVADDDEIVRKQKRHAAIDAMESVAAKFNEQVRAFKKVNP